MESPSKDRRCNDLAYLTTGGLDIKAIWPGWLRRISASLRILHARTNEVCFVGGNLGVLGWWVAGYVHTSLRRRGRQMAGEAGA